MKEALIVIDMLNDFIKPEGALSVGEIGGKIVPFIKSEIEKMRQENKPVIFICDNHKENDPEFAMFPPHCVENTLGAKIIDELQPTKKDFIIPKRRYSGFFGTDLDLVLRENDINTVNLVGVCTNICVLYTAADARMRHYDVNVLKNGVASFDSVAHQFALQQMETVLGANIK